jgi:tetratricopeptide (TPR) repeat protein
MSPISPRLRGQRARAVLESSFTIIVVAYWTATTFLFDHKPETNSPIPLASITVGEETAPGRATAISRTIDSPSKALVEVQKPLAESLEKLATRVAREKGVETAPLRKIIVGLGQARIAEEDIPKKLEAKAAELSGLRAANAKLRQGPAELAGFAMRAQTLIDESAFDAAREVLARGREAARRLGTNGARYEADFLAEEASVDDLQLAYRSAAAKYAEAAALVPASDLDRQWELVEGQARALCRLDSISPDNEALRHAIEIYRRALTLVPRATAPHLWVSTQQNLGAALVSLGERESAATRLEEAVATYRDILPEVTPDSPIWPSIQMHFGRALFRLGERESEPERLAEAVAVYRAVSKAKLFTTGTFENEHNLGVALITLGERETGTKHLEEAVVVLRGASTAFPRKLFPLHWAKTQDNLGIALTSLGAREEGTARLEEAVGAFRAALEERTRERVPLDWATSTGNQGVALMLLAERRSDGTMANQALTQIETAFAVARDGADAASASYFEGQLPKARALVESSTKAGGKNTREKR